MGDWSVIIVRFGLFVDLGVLFGVPLFGLYALSGGPQRHGLVPFRSLILGLAIGGICLSLVGFGLQAASMAGTSIADLDRATLFMLVAETTLGWALAARLAALLAVIWAGLLFRRRPIPALILAAFAGAAAVATLAWSGHGGATEGTVGVVHLVSDILHLVAAAAWLGALFVFLLLVMKGAAGSEEIRIATAHRALAAFSIAGTVIVALIIATGLINGAVLVGVEHVGDLAETLYGQLLLIKLALFAGMLGLAATNRFFLTPTLQAAIEAGDTRTGFQRLRRSLILEVSLALLILALVAWLGTLAPPAAGT